jgi:hypothetical protein
MSSYSPQSDGKYLSALDSWAKVAGFGPGLYELFAHIWGDSGSSSGS